MITQLGNSDNTMGNKITEDAVENIVIALLDEQRYSRLSPEEWEAERQLRAGGQ